jgi:TolB protein
MRNRWIAICTVIILAAAGCRGMRPGATPTAEPAGWVRPTATPIVWLTQAPDSFPTPVPTPIPPPVSAPLRGRIAFQSNRDGSYEIYIMNADGSGLARLTNNLHADVFPAWSPDGEMLAFSSDRSSTLEIYLINADGSGLVRLTDDEANNALPAWSPDGEQIAFVSDRDGNDEIYVMNADGSGVRRLTSDRRQDLFPSWSPDGEWIVFSSNRDIDTEIYKMNRNGGEVTRLTNEPGVDANPAWSPDGEQIAFISLRTGFANLYVMNADGSEVRQLTAYQQSVVEMPAWSPDSRLIAFSADIEETRHIYVIGADGIGLNRLTDAPGEHLYSAWSPDTDALVGGLPEPTPDAEAVCFPTEDPDYGFSPDNPIRLGFDPRIEGLPANQCLPWLLGPQGQPVETELLEELVYQGGKLCRVRITYSGQEEADVMYFDILNFDQPRAPQGYTCGSPAEYVRAVLAARRF